MIKHPLVIGLVCLLPAAWFCIGQAPAKPELKPSTSNMLAKHVVRGVNYAHVHRGGRGYGTQTSEDELANLHDLGVDWIALTPFGYQGSADADEIAGYDPDLPLEHFLNPPPEPEPGSGERRGRNRTMTERHLADQIASAHAKGMQVMLKPHIWSRDFWNGEQWHGTVDQITPEAHARWSRSYLRLILAQARLAQANNVQALCLGTELVRQTAQYPDEWRAMIRQVRKVYDGKLTYAAHWDTEYKAIDFWDELDAIGISAYFPLQVGDDAGVGELVTAWQPYKQQIAAVHQRFGKPVVFLEMGYRPATGAYREPWLYSGGEYAPMIQARGYDALFQTFADEPWWHGVFLWKAFSDAAAGERRGERMGFAFRNLPAEQVVQQWFAGN